MNYKSQKSRSKISSHTETNKTRYFVVNDISIRNVELNVTKLANFERKFKHSLKSSRFFLKISQNNCLTSVLSDDSIKSKAVYHQEAMSWLVL